MIKNAISDSSDRARFRADPSLARRRASGTPRAAVSRVNHAYRCLERQDIRAVLHTVERSDPHPFVVDRFATGASRLLSQCGTWTCRAVRIVGSFVLHYADVMARPRGRTKSARLTVNLDRPTYASLRELARREDVSVSWVVRRAIETLLDRDRASPVGPTLTSPADDGHRAGSGRLTQQ